MLGKLAYILPQGRWRKLSVNVASLFSVQIANYILPLLTVPYVSRVIGPERSGLLMIAMGYNHYFVLLINFGFDLSIVRLIAANRDDLAYINRIFCEVLTAKIILFLIAILLFILLAIWVPSFQQHLWLNLMTCSFCFGTVIFPLWLYQGMEDLARVAVFNLIAKTLFIVGVLLLIRTPDDYLYQNMAVSVGHIVTSVVALIIAVRRYNLKYNLPGWAALYGRFRDGVTLFFSTVVITFYSSSQSLLISFVSTAYAVGIFTAASRLELIVRSFIYLVLNQALFPVIARTFSRGEEYGLATVRRIAPIILSITIVISAGMFIFSPLAIHILYGTQFENAVQILRILSVLPVLLSLNSLLGMHTLLNLHKDRAYFILTACVSALGTVMTYISTLRYGATGTAIAWVLTETLAVLVFYFYLQTHGVQVLSRAAFRAMLNFSMFKSTL